MMTTAQGIIILPHLRIQNANTISSPLTWGFPAVTAILGFVHALERKLSDDNINLKLSGVGMICHKFEPQVSSKGDRVFRLTRNPLDAHGDSAPFVEEGRAHMEISLIIQASGTDCFRADDYRKDVVNDIFEIAQTLRIAGGSVLLRQNTKLEPSFLKWPELARDQENLSRRELRKLLPGFALISQEEELASYLDELKAKNAEATTLDALLDYCCLHIEPSVTDELSGKAEWSVRRLGQGWLVPIPVGYSAISDTYAPGEVLNARDKTKPFRFVESIYSLGEWRSLHRIENLNEIFWHYQTDIHNGLYRCINPKISYEHKEI